MIEQNKNKEVLVYPGADLGGLDWGQNGVKTGTTAITPKSCSAVKRC
jgi:hypothetical protein